MKPAAHVSARWSGVAGGVEVHGEALAPADREAALAAAAAASPWCRREHAGRVEVRQPGPPPGERSRYGGGAERDFVKHATRCARDAAKALLKARGYAVRGALR